MKTQSHLLSSLYLVIFTVLLLPTAMNAQSYRPFHANSVAVYTTAPVAGPTSSLAFTEVELLEGDSIFYPVKTFNSENSQGMLEVDWDNCEEHFWSTGGMCHPVNVPLWLGAAMRKTGSGTYEYTTGGGEILTFDFSISEGDSSLIYQNDDMQLYLIAEGESTGTFLDVEDNIFQYHLAHLNSEGEALGTALHDAPVTLGAQLGAIHFMRIDSFAQISQPITIIGHSGAEAGLYQVKMADLFDFQLGDVFQYYYYMYIPYPYPSESYYETRTVLERIENEFQIIYTFNVHRFTLDNIVNETFMQNLTVSKSVVWASFPFELQETYGPGSSYIPDGYLFKNLKLTTDSCGGSFTYSIIESFYHNCPVEGIACFGHTLHVSPEDYYYTPKYRIYKKGYGMTYLREGMSIAGSGEDVDETTTLIYSSKNGLDCGDQIVLNAGNQVAGKQVLRVYPNPASSTVRFDLPGVLLAQATLHDMQGRRVMDVVIQHNEPTIDISPLPKGMYIVRAMSINGEEFVTKLVVE